MVDGSSNHFSLSHTFLLLLVSYSKGGRMVQITTLFSSAAAILLFGAMGTCQQQWGGPVNRAIVEQQLSDLKEAKVIPEGNACKQQ